MCVECVYVNFHGVILKITLAAVVSVYVTCKCGYSAST